MGYELWASAALQAGLVTLLLALAWLDRYRLVPRLARDRTALPALRSSIRIELVIAFAILAVVTLWRFTPPPRALAVATPISLHLHGEKAMVELEIAREGSAGAPVSHADVLVLDGSFQPLRAKELTLVLASPGTGIEPIRRQAAQTGQSTWRIDSLTFPVAEQWNVRMEVLINDFEKAMLEDTLRLPRMP